MLLEIALMVFSTKFLASSHSVEFTLLDASRMKTKSALAQIDADDEVVEVVVIVVVVEDVVVVAEDDAVDIVYGVVVVINVIVVE